jgi:tripartite-type tricarboxylate transporter receptor subunit TctC
MSMNGVKTSLACWLALAALAHDGTAIAQDKPAGYPVRPIRLVIAVSPGAGGDAIARAAAQMLTDSWGQTAVVDSRPGASGAIAVELVARSAPDGYTLLSLGETLMLLGAAKRVSFDVLKAFDPVVPTSTQPYILVAGLNIPFRSIRELVAYSATQTVTYSGATGVGNTVHLGMERLAQLSGAKLLFVPYKGSAPALIAVMGGEIHMAAASSIAASAAIRSGKVRALAALGLTRIPALPDLPTAAEQGFPGFKIVNRYGLHAPAGTPRRIIDAINRVVSDGMRTPHRWCSGSRPTEPSRRNA